jgi:crotonobetainyl-CoA:carnitine CoA-transferase CaiB-like acyl-CoA transferase
MTHYLRPAVIKKISLDSASSGKLNPRVIYGEIFGFGIVGLGSIGQGQ